MMMVMMIQSLNRCLVIGGLQGEKSGVYLLIVGDRSGYIKDITSVLISKQMFNNLGLSVC